MKLRIGIILAVITVCLTYFKTDVRLQAASSDNIVQVDMNQVSALLTAAADSESDYNRFSTPCLTSPANYFSQVESGGQAISPFYRKNRRTLIFNVVNGFSPYLKNGVQFCVMSRNDYRTTAPHFPETGTEKCRYLSVTGVFRL